MVGFENDAAWESRLEDTTGSGTVFCTTIYEDDTEEDRIGAICTIDSRYSS